MDLFSRSVGAYIRSLSHFRRAAERYLRQPRSARSSDRLLRARLREVAAANAYRAASRLFRAALGLRLSRRTAR